MFQTNKKAHVFFCVYVTCCCFSFLFSQKRGPENEEEVKKNRPEKQVRKKIDDQLTRISHNKSATSIFLGLSLDIDTFTQVIPQTFLSRDVTRLHFVGCPSNFSVDFVAGKLRRDADDDIELVG